MMTIQLAAVSHDHKKDYNSLIFLSTFLYTFTTFAFSYLTVSFLDEANQHFQKHLI
jgi:hypothetical protein